MLGPGVFAFSGAGIVFTSARRVIGIGHSSADVFSAFERERLYLYDIVFPYSVYRFTISGSRALPCGSGLQGVSFESLVPFAARAWLPLSAYRLPNVDLARGRGSGQHSVTPPFVRRALETLTSEGAEGTIFEGSERLAEPAGFCAFLCLLTVYREWEFRSFVY